MNNDYIKSMFGIPVIQNVNDLPEFELKLEPVNLISEEEYQLKKNLTETTIYSYEYICAFFSECKQDELLFGKEYHWSLDEIEKILRMPVYSKFFSPFDVKQAIKPTPY